MDDKPQGEAKVKVIFGGRGEFTPPPEEKAEEKERIDENGE
jgi:hypothetical protein